MIYLIIGTKAQFIKMAPVARILDQRQIAYCIVDLGQHAAITRRILDDFGLKQDPLRLLSRSTNVSSYVEGAAWLLRHFALLARHNRLRQLFQPQGQDFALVHGDTASTLLGLLYARRLGIPTGLVEAGLSSGSWRSPFPEEIIRRTVQRFSDALFPPGRKETENLMARKCRGKIVNTGYNTGRDALEIVQSAANPVAGTTTRGFALCTLHRLETIGSETRLRAVTNYLTELAGRLGQLRFVMHEPTLRALKRHNLLQRLSKAANIEISQLRSYPEFIEILRSARWVLTDGGSIQEEASYLGKPCLILRERTERPHGVGTTAKLASFNAATDAAFLRAVECVEERPTCTMSASTIIADYLFERSQDSRH